MLLLFLKSQIAGYMRRNGTYVAPHADRRSRRIPDDKQLLLFPKPEKKPIPPNPFKGLDPVKSTGDLFEHVDYDWEQGHGHVRPRADGVRMRCGGSGVCSTCNRERVLDAAERLRARTA
ncbi:hypothetical protein [Paraburkholderia phenoliruptrix]|uniref:hypothetical protein n=1 Tax=Paraburkholderia phenoliruptrix TaxID=252970 RepID=UPI0034CDBDE4